MRNESSAAAAAAAAAPPPPALILVRLIDKQKKEWLVVEDTGEGAYLDANGRGRQVLKVPWSDELEEWMDNHREEIRSGNIDIFLGYYRRQLELQEQEQRQAQQQLSKAEKLSIQSLRPEYKRQHSVFMKKFWSIPNNRKQMNEIKSSDEYRRRQSEIMNAYYKSDKWKQRKKEKEEKKKKNKIKQKDLVS